MGKLTVLVPTQRVRGLAREQFLKRALINKIQLGLAARAALRA